MFDTAANDEYWEGRHPSTTAVSTGLIDGIRADAVAENRAAAAQLVKIGELFAHRLSRCSDTEQWCVDTMDAVAAEVAAALRIGHGLAMSQLHVARAMRERLPRVGEVFCAGDIDGSTFRTIVFRTDLIEDPEVLARVDELIAVNVTRWPSLSRGRLAGQVDRIVARADADAVRRRKERRQGREVTIWDDSEGLSHIEGTLSTPDGHALDRCLTALAATVCPHDPRTAAQRRADALGALAARAERLGCRCERPDCTAGARAPVSPVVIHVIAEQASLHGNGGAPGSEVATNGLITPDLIAELARSAKLVPLANPGWAAPEPHYTPSKALADFVRCRDLTCRWPGCDVPAARCDLEHTVPYAAGGPTHAANIKCYCRTHHLMKTFWGWTEKQLADGTLILTSPAGDTYVTTPGSALLFPSLCAAVGGMPAPETPPPADYCAERSAMMPKRRRTRAQDRAQRVKAERRHNRAARMTRRAEPVSSSSPAPPSPEDEPPPF